jgi:hypothetical protein
MSAAMQCPRLAVEVGMNRLHRIAKAGLINTSPKAAINKAFLKSALPRNPPGIFNRTVFEINLAQHDNPG